MGNKPPKTRVTSPVIDCDGKVALPNHVFVLSLENRSFDHLFGRMRFDGFKDAYSKEPKQLNGVLNQDGSINTGLTNSYNGKSYPIPNGGAQFRMPGDPKHEYEHILAQCCGRAAAKSMLQAYGVEGDANKFPLPTQAEPKKKGRLYARPAANNSGFIEAWVSGFTINRNEGMSPPGIAASLPVSDPLADINEVMRCFDTKAQLPTFYDLASKYLICDNFYCSLPGPTGPNRFFMMAGSAAGYDHSPSSSEMIWFSQAGHLPVKGNIFKQCESAGVKWHIFGDDKDPMAGVCEGVHNEHIDLVHGSDAGTLQSMLKSSDPFPYNFVWIEPNYDVTPSIGARPMYSGGNSMHPCSDVSDAQQLVLDLYNMISANKSVWNSCVFIITWDEHGGFYDHVIPPAAPEPGDGMTFGENNQWGFEFNVLGVRVPCLIVSPLLDGAGLIDSTQYDHGSILKFVNDLFNAGAFTGGTVPAAKMKPLTKRVEWAKSFMKLFPGGKTKMDGAVASIASPPPSSAPPSGNPADASAPMSGNVPLIVASTMQVHAQTDPTFDPQAEMAKIKTNQDAVDYLNRADAYLFSVA